MKPERFQCHRILPQESQTSDAREFINSLEVARKWQCFCVEAVRRCEGVAGRPHACSEVFFHVLRLLDLRHAILDCGMPHSHSHLPRTAHITNVGKLLDKCRRNYLSLHRKISATVLGIGDSHITCSKLGLDVFVIIFAPHFRAVTIVA